MAKVAIIGATGNVGQFAAHAITEIPHLSNLLLFGREGREELLEGIASDFMDSFAAKGRDLSLSWSTSPQDLAGSDIVIVTAGVPRHSGQNRNDLAFANARLVAETAAMVGEIAPESLMLMVTNPVDVMTAVALEYSGMEPRRVFGLGTHLDSMRLKALISRHFNVHVSEVHTRIIGEHGDSMVPLWSATTIGGIAISNLPAFSNLPMEELMVNVRQAGENIIRKKGSTVYGPGEAIATLVRTVLGNENRILTVSSYIKSEIHDIGNVCIGVPARVNRSGVYPVPIRIEPNEVVAFQSSTEKIRAITTSILERLKEPDR
ncbi:MAG: malate dehydrogenase [Methanomicrobiales archaeon]|nr:malate dehydrogenase [Methanomicrobiales archaeon]